MVISKLKEGMSVYDVRPTKGLNRFNGKWQSWTVKIIEIDLENKKIFASWNSNSPQWYSERTWKKWRLKYPQS